MMVNASKSNKQHQRKKTQETILTEERNSMIEEQFEEPQHLEQSKRVLWHKACSWTNDISKASRKHRFLSVQTIHIKQPKTIFHISELNFPSQWFQQNIKLSTKLGMTHWMPKIWSISTHNEWATEQWRRRWSTDSSLQQHIQHWFAKEKPLSMRLSKIKIRQWTVVHKKVTLLGTLTFPKYPSMEN